MQRPSTGRDPRQRGLCAQGSGENSAKSVTAVQCCCCGHWAVHGFCSLQRSLLGLCVKAPIWLAVMLITLLKGDVTTVLLGLHCRVHLPPLLSQPVEAISGGLTFCAVSKVSLVLP